MLSLLISFGAALIFAYSLTPLVIREAHKAGVLDVPSDKRRAHSVPIPRLGGVAVFLAVFLTWVGKSIATGFAWSPFGPQYQNLPLGIVIGSGVIFFVGFLDDVRGVSPLIKLIFQVSAALAVVSYGFTPNSFAVVKGASIWSSGELVSTCVLIFWIVGVTNAFNLIDGLDGLAGSITLVALIIVMASISVIQPQFSAMAPMMLAGAMLGFLRYNWHPARIFLGDAGSMTIGFLLAILTVVSATDNNGVVYPVVPLLALAYPITDTFVAMARRWVRGVPLSLADSRHIHHQLRTAGLTVQATVRVLSLVFGLIAFFGLTTMFAPPKFVFGVIITGVPMLLIGAIYGVRWLRYDEFIQLASSITSVLQQARRVVRIKIRSNEAAALITSAKSTAEIKEILDALAEEVGLLEIELVMDGQRDGATPPSQQIVRIDEPPIRMDYTIMLPSNTINRRIIVRFWRGIGTGHQTHILERVASRIGPAINDWIKSQSTDEMKVQESISTAGRAEKPRL